MSEKRKKYVLMFVLFTGLTCLDIQAAIPDLEPRIFGFVDVYYNTMEPLYHKIESGEELSIEEVNAAIDNLNSKSGELSGQIIGEMENGDDSSFQEMVRVYNHHVYEKEAFDLREPFNYIAEDLVEYGQSKGPGFREQEYFPGYGYTEDGPFGYKYRRTRELKKELYSEYWKDMNEEFQEGEKKTLTMEMELAESLGASLEPIGVPIEAEINGKMKMVQTYEMTFHSNVKATFVEKYHKIKVWFELQRRKKHFWIMFGSWEKAGETYQIIEEPAPTIG